MNQEQARVPVEVIAVITAAIAAALDQPVGNFAITNIEPAGQPALAGTSAWAKAGLIQTHLARAGFGSRSRA